VKSLLKIEGSPKARPEADGLRYLHPISAVWMTYGAHIGELNTTFFDDYFTSGSSW
jgi:hypothetical protein